MSDAMESDDYRRAEALASSKAFVGHVISALGPGGDPETKAKLQHARFQLPEPRETVRFAAFAGAWSARVTRTVAEEIADEVTNEFMGS